MSDTFDQGAAALSATPLTQAIVAASTWATVGEPVHTSPAWRALLDAVHDLEQRVIALGG